MKTLTVWTALFTSILLATLNFPASAAEADDAITLRPAVYQSVQIPRGLTERDSVEIVGEGLFPNSCYRRIAPARVLVHPENQTIEIFPSATFYDGFCLMVQVPFHQTIRIESIPAGTYRLLQGSDPDVMSELGTLTIAP